MPPQPSEFDQLGSGGQYGRSPFVAEAMNGQGLDALQSARPNRYSVAAKFLGLFGNAALEGAKFPGDLLQGKYVAQQADPSVLTEQDVENARRMNTQVYNAAPAMALGLLGGRMSLPGAASAEQGVLGTFGSGRTLDRVFRTNKTDQAIALTAKGADPETVWQTTGRLLGPDGRWIGEVPDVGAELKRGDIGFKGRLEDVVHNPDVYNVWPGLKRIPVEIQQSPYPKEAAGSYMGPPAEKITIMAPTEDRMARKTLSAGIHETGHAVATKEGLAPGASFNLYQKQAGPNASPQSVMDRYASQLGELYQRIAQERLGMRPRYLEKYSPLTSDVVKQYPFMSAGMDRGPLPQSFIPNNPRAIFDATPAEIRGYIDALQGRAGPGGPVPAGKAAADMLDVLRRLANVK